MKLQEAAQPESPVARRALRKARELSPSVIWNLVVADPDDIVASQLPSGAYCIGWLKDNCKTTQYAVFWNPRTGEGRLIRRSREVRRQL